MAVALAGTAVAHGNGTTPASITLPAWTVGAHDKIFVAVLADSATTTFSTPTGFSILCAATVAGSGVAPTLIVFERDAVGGDSGASVSSTLSAGMNWSANARVYSGVIAVDASGIVGDGSIANSNITWPTVTEPSGDTIVGFYGLDSTDGTIALIDPGSWVNPIGALTSSPFTWLKSSDTATPADYSNQAFVSNGPGGVAAALIALTGNFPPPPPKLTVVSQAVQRAANW